MPYMVVVSSWGSERECRKEVRDAGFVTYQPMTRERINYRGRRTWAERTLLGRYFFAKWENGCPWRQLFDLKRVDGVFMRVDESLPSLVRDDEIDRIRAMEDKSGFCVLENARNGFMKGQRVYATAGVMIGLLGEYVGIGRGGCEVALLDLFGQLSRVEFRPGVLAAA